MCIKKMYDFRVFEAGSTKKGMRWHATFPSGDASSETL